ncbi:MAG: alpha/beta hydrolase, partial [Bacteroidota bacterium]
ASWGGTLGPATLLKGQDAFRGWINVAGVHDPKGLYGEYLVRLPEMARAQIAAGNSTSHWEGVLELVEEVGEIYSEEDFFRLNNAAHNSEAVLAEDMVTNEIQFLDEYGSPQQFPVRNNGMIMSILTQNGLWEDVSFTSRLPEITLPSLIFWGENDLIVPPRFAQEAYDHLGATHKELFLFERSGHSPLLTEPDLFAERVITFINELR